MARSVREIDRNEDKYVGIGFPLDHSPEGFFYKTKTVLEQAKANLQNLLLTTPGERIMQPEFGSQLKFIVFEQGENIPDRIEEAINSAVDKHLAYINIENVFTTQQDNQLNVSIEFSVPLNPDDISFDRKDIRADVTDLVSNHIYSSSVYPNNGFIVKREDSGSYGNNPATSSFGFDSGQEGDSTRLGNLKYFSRETHTIYPPKLEVVWDDSSWNSGSLSALSATDLERLKIYFKNLRPEYKEKSIVKFRIVGRELYPTTSFATTPAELDVKYLPSASTEYEIRDAETEEVIVPFGSGSRVSCDTTGNFFRVQMDGLQAERNYRFCLKVVSGSGTTDEEINFYDDNYEFRVVR